MVAGQRWRVGRTHAGTNVTIVVEDHHFRVLDGIKELSLHARTSTTPIGNSTLTAPGSGNHVPTTMRHLCPETTQVIATARDTLIALENSLAPPPGPVIGGTGRPDTADGPSGGRG